MSLKSHCFEKEYYVSPTICSFLVFLPCVTLSICCLHPIGHFRLHINIMPGLFLAIGMFEGPCKDGIVEPNVFGRGVTNIEMDTISFL